MLSEKSIWISFNPNESVNCNQKNLGKSIKINSNLFSILIQELIVDPSHKSNMNKKLEILKQKEEIHGIKNYCLLQKSNNSNIINKLDLTSGCLEMFQKNQNGFERIYNTFDLGNEYKEIRVKIYGVYFSGFEFKIDYADVLTEIVNAPQNLFSLKKRSRNNSFYNDEKDIHFKTTLKKINRIQIDSKPEPQINSKIIFEECVDMKEIISTREVIKHEDQEKNKSMISSKQSELNNCAICIDTINIKKGVLDCDHKYCFECIENWTKETNKCPICKINSKLLRTFEGNKFISSNFLNDQDFQFENPREPIDEIIENADPFCYVCNTSENANFMLICDKCDTKCCHINCLDPPMRFIPEDEWYCDYCVRDHNLRYNNPIANIFSNLPKKKKIKRSVRKSRKRNIPQRKRNVSRKKRIQTKNKKRKESLDSFIINDRNINRGRRNKYRTESEDSFIVSEDDMVKNKPQKINRKKNLSKKSKNKSILDNL